MHYKLVPISPNYILAFEYLQLRHVYVKMYYNVYANNNNNKIAQHYR